MEQNQSKSTETTTNISKEERKLSTIGGFVLMTAALGMKKLRLPLSLISANLFYRGATGQSLIYKLLGKNTAVHNTDAAISVPHEQGIHVSQSITINRPVEEVYDFWRNFENLPRFMEYLESITVESPSQSHWRVKGPVGMTIEWDAEVINDKPNEVIGWRTLKNPYVDHAGSVRFRTAPGNQGTEVNVELEYSPMAGELGAAVAKILGKSPKRQILNSLRQLKQHLEVGEIATTDGQPSGRA